MLNHNLPAERDKRPVTELVGVAAQHSGAGDAAQLVSKLHQHGVQWAWQLECADHEDWAAYGATHGLKMAVKAELKNPSVVTSIAGAVHSQAEFMEHDRLRRFLLIADANGNEPPRMGEMSGTFFALLLVAPAHRQGLLTRCFKLMGLMSGLLMVPASIMLNEFSGAEVPDDESVGAWSRRPTRGDVKGAVAATIFATDMIVALTSVVCAAMVSCAGWRAPVRFFELLLPVLGFTFGTLIWMVATPLLVLIFVKTFDEANSPYPGLAAVLVFWAVSCAIFHRVWQFMLRAMPLETYHHPSAELFILRFIVPLLFSQFGDTALLPAARKRAAELRAIAGIDAPDDAGGPGPGQARAAKPIQSRVAPA